MVGIDDDLLKARHLGLEEVRLTSSTHICGASRNSASRQSPCRRSPACAGPDELRFSFIDIRLRAW